MQQIPLRKITLVALVTSPMLGLIGSLPAMVIEKIETRRLPAAFLFITAIAFAFWIFNVLLLLSGKLVPVFRHSWLRHSISILVSVLLLALIFKRVMPKPVGPPPELMIQNEKSKFPANEEVALFKKRKPKLLFFPIIQAQSLNLIVIILLELFQLRNRKQQMENENNRLRLANLQARNSQLIQQLHPHFLFNSLNSLKSLIRRSPDLAEDYLLKMADLLRYSSSSPDRNVVSLREEVHIAQNYLFMQQVRFGAALAFEINTDEALLNNSSVPVFSIQLLIENAIKHNVVTVQQPLKIIITGNTPDNTVSVSNNFQPKENRNGNAGIGLQNLAERYKLIGQPPPVVTKSEGVFRVTIKVMQNESSDS